MPADTPITSNVRKALALLCDVGVEPAALRMGETKFRELKKECQPGTALSAAEPPFFDGLPVWVHRD